ncbi:MAG TPA: M15 family metallopeptidase [Candidatus Limnocylindria bacterium]|nr:M15 family metallopeptidase [Candidatus Limnocylindria bacterium]
MSDLVFSLPVAWQARPFDPETDLAPETYPVLGRERSCDGAGDRPPALRKAWQILRRQRPLRAATPASRGWGPGWPNCQYGRWVTIAKRDIKLTVHRGIAELIAILIDYTELVLGYDCKPGQCWGAACRSIRGSSTPSNHSWALAVDLNSLSNPMGYYHPPRTDMPPAMVATWKRYGFRWGGDYSGRTDAMHYEFMGTPADAKAQTERARRELAGGSVKPPLAPAPTRPELRRGSTGEAVKILQRGLGTEADGIFGAGTESSVKRFQAANGLDPDGIVGPKTWQTLERKEWDRMASKDEVKAAAKEALIEVVSSHAISEEPRNYGATRAYTIKDFLLAGWRALYKGVTVDGKPAVEQHLNVVERRQVEDHELLVAIADKLGVERSK